MVFFFWPGIIAFLSELSFLTYRNFHHGLPPPVKKMRTKFALLAVAGLGATQSILDVIPDCAKECLSEGIDNATDCEIDDGMCICEVDNYRNIYSVSYACVLLDCGEAVAISK